MFFRRFDASFLILLAISAACIFYRFPLFSLNGFWNLQMIQWSQLVLILLLSSRFVAVPKFSFIVFCYILSRVILFQSNPVLEDDYFRYLWDGNLVSKGINPYLYPPSDSFFINIPSEWRQFINFPDIRTIYPPLTQFYFAAIFFIFGESIPGLRVGAIIIEALLALSLLKLVRSEKLNLKPIALFLFFPTLLKENVNSVHFDLLATLFLFHCFCYLKKNNTSFSNTLTVWISLASAVMVKIFPLLFLPVVFFTSKRKVLGLILFTFFILLCYSPFLDAGLQLFSGSTAFAKDWLFFESTAYYVQKFYNFSLQFFNLTDPGFISLISSGALTRLTLGLALMLVSLFISLSKKISLQNKFILLFLLLYTFTTVLNSWYWLWALPFLILFAPRIAWTLPVFTTLGYSWFIDENLYFSLHYPAYGLITLFIIIYILKTKYNGMARWQKNMPDLL